MQATGILDASGVDPSGSPYQIFKAVWMNGQTGSNIIFKDLGERVNTKLLFQGNYQEPQLALSLPVEAFNETKEEGT